VFVVMKNGELGRIMQFTLEYIKVVRYSSNIGRGTGAGCYRLPGSQFAGEMILCHKPSGRLP